VFVDGAASAHRAEVAGGTTIPLARFTSCNMLATGDTSPRTSLALILKCEKLDAFRWKDKSILGIPFRSPKWPHNMHNAISHSWLPGLDPTRQSVVQMRRRQLHELLWAMDTIRSAPCITTSPEDTASRL
jgi:hypothetical protein